jgi:energy-converting hydrogenase B subunit D
MTGLEILLLLFLVFCALASVLTRNLVASVIIFMSYSSVMAIIWLLLASPDLAITEAAVGAGVTSLLFFLALRKVNQLRGVDRDET